MRNVKEARNLRCFIYRSENYFKRETKERPILKISYGAVVLRATENLVVRTFRERNFLGKEKRRNCLTEKWSLSGAHAGFEFLLRPWSSHLSASQLLQLLEKLLVLDQRSFKVPSSLSR